VNDAHEPGRTTGTPRPTVAPPGVVPVGWRIAAGLAAVASVPAIVVTWFVGVIAFTGCFIKCDEASADPLGGFLLYTLAGVLLVAGAVCTKLAATGRTAGTTRVAIFSASIAAVLVVFSGAM
jgi:hypothetical protein